MLREDQDVFKIPFTKEFVDLTMLVKYCTKRLFFSSNSKLFDSITTSCAPSPPASSPWIGVVVCSPFQSPPAARSLPPAPPPAQQSHAGRR